MPRKAEPIAAPVVSDNFKRLHGFILWVVRRSEIKEELSFRQIAILLSLRTGECVPGVKELSEHLSVSKPAITRAVDRLCELKLLERVVNASDRRTVSLSLTTEGKAALRGLEKHV